MDCRLRAPFIQSGLVDQINGLFWPNITRTQAALFFAANKERLDIHVEITFYSCWQSVKQSVKQTLCSRKALSNTQSLISSSFDGPCQHNERGIHKARRGTVSVFPDYGFIYHHWYTKRSKEVDLRPHRSDKIIQAVEANEILQLREKRTYAKGLPELELLTPAVNTSFYELDEKVLVWNRQKSMDNRQLVQTEIKGRWDGQDQHRLSQR